MENKVTINAEQELYVIPAGDGYTCMGFDYTIARATALAKWLRQTVPQFARGTMAAWDAYQTLLDCARGRCEREQTKCPIELTPELEGLEGKRVEVVDCHGERRRFWVGKSTGWMPCHLEIKTKKSSGGPAVMGTPFKSVCVIGGVDRRTYPA